MERFGSLPIIASVLFMGEIGSAFVPDVYPGDRLWASAEIFHENIVFCGIPSKTENAVH